MRINIKIISFVSLISWLLLNPAIGKSQFTFLPEGSYFKTIILDPSASQLSGSLLGIHSKGDLEQKVYAPINLGIRKMYFRWEDDLERGFELGIEFAIHSQFTVIDVGSNYLGGFQNADYRIAGVAHLVRRLHTYRFTIFHQSSHLGDDYIIRNQIVSPTSNVMNYEQIDVTRSTEIGNSRYYVGAGVNFSPNTVRERLAAQVGYFYSRPLTGNPELGFLAGTDIKIFQQNDFQPNFKLGVGLEFGRTKAKPLRLMLEYYNGHLPYSTLEYQKVQLFGAGLYFDTNI
ncbi:MAG: DUF1207 domain-containing protein [Candidatus Marinimicrobia bacterium]|nr:DUF1207 domain-containing protein [Candidatus Neomarinimicrobiota bacterium]